MLYILYYNHHSPYIEPAPNHSLADGVEFFHTKLHEERGGRDNHAVTRQHRDVHHDFQAGQTLELHHLQADQG